MKHAFIAAQRTFYPIVMLCRVLDVSVSGFYTFASRIEQPKVDADAALRGDLITIHQGSRRTYGRPRLVRGLRACGHRVNPKRVQRLMREEGVRGVRKGRFKPCTTDSKHAVPVAPNVLDRRFAVDADINAWVSDITYIPRVQAGCTWPS